MPGTVKRFTTEYLADEDRMRISIAFNDGTVQVLWLTRRLLDRVIARLVAQVGCAPLPGGVDGDRARTRVQQRFNQQAATASMTPQEPVRATKAEQQAQPPTLITGVDLRPGQTVLALDFRAGDTVVAQIPFRKEALRQWLGVLHNRYEKAGWNGQFWPDWIRSDADVTKVDSSRIN